MTTGPITVLRITTEPPTLHPGRRIDMPNTHPRYAAARLSVRVMFTDRRARIVIGRKGKWRVFRLRGDPKRYGFRLTAVDKAQLDAMYERALAASLF